jgi:SAM-dependent methyltransferase
MTTGRRITSRSRLALAARYAASDLSVFDEEERRRFVVRQRPGRIPEAVAWELLYRLEPRLYDRLIQAEPLHPAILDWLPRTVDSVLEVAAGTGRLTLELAGRCTEMIAVEPAAPMRQILQRKLEAAGLEGRVRVVPGFFDALPAPDAWAELVVACSALTPEPAHGGDVGLQEMERCCRPGGRVAIVWPNHLGWLAHRGYQYRSFPGDMSMTFASLEEALELANVFYPRAVPEIRRRGKATVPYGVLGVHPPRDVAFKDKVS